MIALTAEDIRVLHDYALERYGGPAGEVEPGIIDFMAEKPFQEAFGIELYPGLFYKAAIYMEGFACKQVFVEGNKRTAYLCGRTFLRLNGYTLHVTDMELYDTMMELARKEIDVDYLAEWLEEHCEES